MAEHRLLLQRADLPPQVRATLEQSVAEYVGIVQDIARREPALRELASGL